MRHCIARASSSRHADAHNRWWPGALGRTATHAVVYASLLLPQDDGTTKDMGIHAFMLQIRSLEDHTDMPGVMIGTIGARCTYPLLLPLGACPDATDCRTECAYVRMFVLQAPSSAPTALTTGGCA